MQIKIKSRAARDLNLLAENQHLLGENTLRAAPAANLLGSSTQAQSTYEPFSSFIIII
jgi:hypothetical protein